MSEAHQAKRVAVIGAGPSGLATMKELCEEGHSVVCFEKNDSLGGVFQFRETDGVVWESCRLTSSKVLTAFSDFPIRGTSSSHLTLSEYVHYLTEYAQEFGLLRHIRFKTSVERVSRSFEGGWTVRVCDAAGCREESFHAVAVCSGLNQYPSIPEFPGQAKFLGEAIHGAQYRRPAQLTGKRVLIIGGGESGTDIAAEASVHAVETVLSLRRGMAVIPRTKGRHPRDFSELPNCE